MPWITGSAGWWEGGRIWLDQRGRKTYFIRKTIGGKAYEYTTRRSTEHAAKIELARFMDDPEDPGAASSDALRLTADLVRPFLAWSLAPAKEGGKGNSVRGRGYKAVLTPDLEVGGYTVEVRELPGCLTEGDDLADAKRMAKDAIELWLSVAEPQKARGPGSLRVSRRWGDSPVSKRSE